MMLKPARLLIALIALAAAPVFAAEPAVTVNGKPISADKIEKLVKEVVAQGKGQDGPQLREQIKQQLIAREVLLQEADKQGFATKADVKAQIENTRQSVIINAMLLDYVKKNPVKDADVQAEYDKYKAQQGPKEYNARHILVATEAEAKDIIAKLKSGSKFEELAKVSKDASGQNGGDLGWAAPGMYVKPFSEAMVALKKGEVTEKPVQSQFGFHVIRLEDTRDTQFPPLDQVKGQVAEQLTQRKVDAFRQDLLSKAKIK